MTNQTKTCTKSNNCTHPDGPKLLLSEFYKDTYGKYGVRNICKKCCSEYYHKNKEKNLERDHKYRTKHKKEIKLYREEYYKTAENKGRLKIYHKKWYIKNKTKILKQTKQYRENNIEYYKEYKKQHRQDNIEFYNSYNKNYKNNRRK